MLGFCHEHLPSGWILQIFFNYVTIIIRNTGLRLMLLINIMEHLLMATFTKRMEQHSHQIQILHYSESFVWKRNILVV